MHDPMQPILAMTRLTDLRVHVAQSGLSIGDSATAAGTSDGSVAIFAPVRRYLLGLFRHHPMRLLGHLSPAASGLIAPALRAGQPFRVRIVGLTPEHLAPEPQVHISIWGDPKRLMLAQPFSPV